MTASLKSLIPSLAKALDMKPAAIYERQRALVRAGLVESRPGRGPGSGVRATPHSLAVLLLSIAASDSLSEVEKQTQAVANLKSADGPCPLTGKRTLAAALAAALASEQLTAHLFLLRIRRSAEKVCAELAFMKNPNKVRAKAAKTTEEAAIKAITADLGKIQFGRDFFSARTMEIVLSLVHVVEEVDLKEIRE